MRWLGLVVLCAMLALLLWSRSGGALEIGRGPFRPDGLKAASRDHLALCVEGIAGANLDPASAVANVRAALQSAQHRPVWTMLGIQDDPTDVVYGCLTPPVLPTSGGPIGRLQREMIGTRVTVA